MPPENVMSIEKYHFSDFTYSPSEKGRKCGPLQKIIESQNYLG